LSDKILLAARIESRSEAFQSERLNLSEFVQETMVQLRNSTGRDHITNLNIEDNLYVNSDHQAAYSILSNLYENAIKYSPKGSEVRLSLQSKGSLVELAVSDLGPGIPDSEKLRVFDKFYRPGNENTRTNKGTGLGLYIVNELAQLMQLEIELKDNTPTGTVMIIKFERK
jgi:K+-sensing histidine kinase KdpD